MKTLKIAFFIALLSSNSVLAEIMTLKSKNGLEKKFDIIAVSQENIRYKDRNNLKTLPINLLDEKDLASNKKIYNAIKESKSIGNEHLDDYNSESPNDRRYEDPSDPFAVFSSTISKKQLEAIKNKTKNLRGKIKAINFNGTEAKISVQVRDPKDSMKFIDSEWTVINLPSEMLKIGHNVSVKIAPTIKKDVYICLNDKENFDAAIKNIFIPIDYKPTPNKNDPFANPPAKDPFANPDNDPFRVPDYEPFKPKTDNLDD